MTATLARTQAALRTIAGSVPTRSGRPCGPFDVYLDARERPTASFAYPRDGATVTASDVDALTAMFRDAQRMPRVESFPALAPSAITALKAAGFVEELDGPVMTCSAPVEVPPVTGLTLTPLTPQTDGDVLIGFYDVMAAAFEDGPESHDVPMYRKRLKRDVSLMGQLDGEIVATGVLMDAVDGCAEVAAIGTAELVRGRGIAGALVSDLVHRAFAAGAELCFLTAASGDSRRVYERAGFVLAGEFLHLRCP